MRVFIGIVAIVAVLLFAVWMLWGYFNDED